MNRIEFDLLNIKDQINYINEMLDNGYTLSKVCNEINISKSTMGTRIKANGYIKDLNKNKYILDDGESLKHKENNKENNDILKTILESPELIELINKVNTLENNVNVNTKAIKSLKGNNGTNSNNVLSIKKFEGESRQSTIRVNANIYNRLDKMYEKYGLYNRQDVLNSLLDEILSKYE